MSASVLPLPPSSRYRVASCIAHGGMGSVYVGIQRGAGGFKRPVAIKRAHKHLLASPDFRALILSEARIASAVRHPNVVSVDDVEENDGELLLVMDYVEGTSLSHVLAATFSIPPSVSVRIALDICAGLSAIHGTRDDAGRALGLVHRDVSPQNVLIDTDGLARLTDFGIARGTADAKRVDELEPPGKLGYMAPEYLKGGGSSPQADLFALGIVLWESLAGRTLFRGDTPADSLRLTLEGHVTPPSHFDPSLPAALDRVLAKCLAPDPAHRYGSARDLASALEAALPPADREDVADVICSVASPMLAEHRAAISEARLSGRPPADALPPPAAFDLDEAPVSIARLAMPESLSIVLQEEELERASAVPASQRETITELPIHEPTFARMARSRTMIAVGVALVTFVLSSTVLIIELAAT